MAEIPEEIQKTIVASEIPEQHKTIVSELFGKFGFEWISELYECPETKGIGSSSIGIDIFDIMSDDAKREMQKTLDEMQEMLKQLAEIRRTPEPDPYEAINEFIEAIEFMDWEDDLRDELDFKKDILQTWWDSRVDYLRSVKKLKIDLAREGASKEVESIDIGLEELMCKKCGVFFYDNLSKHFGIKELYCSVSCEASSILDCLQCGLEYEVGRGPARIRLVRLEGFCSTECLSDFKNLQDADNRYRNSMKRTAAKFNVSYDESITRREVFTRGSGICYICGALTHFENSDEFSPLLATVDHLIPWTRGGQHSWENVKLCCLRCNMVKGNR
jgi:5-methylcytosine-specific restriction endonuclease McrA